MFIWHIIELFSKLNLYFYRNINKTHNSNRYKTNMKSIEIDSQICIMNLYFYRNININAFMNHGEI